MSADKGKRTWYRGTLKCGQANILGHERMYLGVRVSDRKKSGGCNTTFFPITFCS